MTLPTNKYMKTVFLFFLLMAYPVSGIHYSVTCIAQTQSEDEIEFKKCLTKAQAGDVNAQVKLGNCYYDGKGIPQNYEKAVEWYTKAAKQGNAKAQCNLGYCYELGNGVLQSAEKAVEWYIKAAEQGHAIAQCNLGLCYKDGKGVSQSFAKAAKWFIKAAEQGNENAQCNLGLCYELGNGVLQSAEKAVEWYIKAAEQGNEDAQYYLGWCYYEGKGVPQNYEKAMEWFDKVAEKGEYLSEAADELVNECLKELNSQKGGQNVLQEEIRQDSRIDIDIPTVMGENNKTFAVIIGNENYRMVPHVEYAQNDAKIFAAYCQKTLGLPARNIRSYSDATYGTMLAALKDIKDIADAYNGNIDVIFYYAGHGIPDGKGNAYLLPVDADGTQTEVCMPTSRLYQKLNELSAMKLVVFMDACFSGAQRGDGMLMAARGVAIKSVSDIPAGNSVVFCASNGEETAFPFKEKGHGMFTYFLLKKLQETKGDVTLGDLASYIVEQVCQQSVIINRKLQTPTVIPSRSISESWKNMKLK